MNAVESVVCAAGNQLFQIAALAQLAALILIRARVIALIDELVQVERAKIAQNQLLSGQNRAAVEHFLPSP